jgi:hypothetical protein
MFLPEEINKYGSHTPIMRSKSVGRTLSLQPGLDRTSGVRFSYF